VGYRDDPSVVADDGVHAQPPLDATETTSSTEVSLEARPCGLVEEEPVGASAPHRTAAALQEFDDEIGDRPLLKAACGMG
jgi:hypothetical protein